MARVLISAYACEPNRGSEPGVGWKWSQAASVHHEVWVLTRPRLDCEFDRDDQPDAIRTHFIFFDLPSRLQFGKSGPKGDRIEYLIWQVAVLPTAIRAHLRHRFDIVHHLTFNTIDVPGLLWLLPARFVWGPVGAGQSPPEALKEYFRASWRQEERRTSRKRLLRFSPIHWMAVRRASWIIVANQDTETLLRTFRPRRLIRRLEICLPPEQLQYDDRHREQSERLVVGWAGTLESHKAPLLAIQVVESLLGSGTPVELLIAGEGPMRAELERYLVGNRLDSHVQFLGSLSHEEMSEFYRGIDVFLFTSLRDTSGNVVAEAMAKGRPVVALDHQGVAEMVTSETGVLVPVGDPASVLREMSRAIAELSANESFRADLGLAAHHRAKDLFNCDKIVQMLDSIYHTP